MPAILQKIFTLILGLGLTLSCPDEPHCNACAPFDGPSACGFCFQGYLNENHRCVKISRLQQRANCDTYFAPRFEDESPPCLSCATGYFVEENSCQACTLAHCAECSKNNACTACSGGRKLRLEPVPECLEESNEVAHCDQCEYRKDRNLCHCLKCDTGYSLVYNQDDVTSCVENTGQFCLILDDPKSKRCRFCDLGYYLGPTSDCIANDYKPSKWYLWVLIAAVALGISATFLCYKSNSHPPDEQLMLRN
jgi:hypothetical protein